MWRVESLACMKRRGGQEGHRADDGCNIVASSGGRFGSASMSGGGGGFGGRGRGGGIRG